MRGNKDFLLKEAATILRKDIVDMIDESTDLPWPPTAESLSLEKQTTTREHKEVSKNSTA